MGVQDLKTQHKTRIRRNPEINSNEDPGQKNTEFTLLEKSSGVTSSERQTTPDTQCSRKFWKEIYVIKEVFGFELLLST